ncbi:gag/pol protein [Cucumis melo var. makuwa]|uniref:Gag/pol protein n=1 Tax=Cucumis melo var. makuwa TaxID=1194695 RepID=A0A5D3DC34_CUCMM|nr:gag/pol protein [Cucumis melo var. makuwa]TYK21132.1 gag/pol protein [Cucumis melo var. makuwa]
MFGQLSIQIKQEANVAHSRRFAPSSSGSKKIQKRKRGKGKGHIVAAEGKGKAKVAIKGKCFHCNVDGRWKRNCPKYLAKKKEKEGATNHVCSSLQETSSFKQLEESEMTLKVGMGDVISARAVGDAKLGHINLDRIGRLVKNGLLNELEDDSLPSCESCLEGKMTKRPFTGKDDYSRYGYLYLMEHKSEALEKFMEYKAEVENLLTPGTPQQNGISERRNRTLLDMVRSMMSYTQLPSSFWGYAVETAFHILNNVSLKSVSETPFELCQFVGYPKEMRGGLFFDPQENKVFVSTNATFLKEDHMRDHKPRSKLVLNEATDGSTRVVDEVGPSSRFDETTTSGQSHPSQPLRMPRCSGMIVSQSNRYLGLTKTQVVIPDDGVEDPLSYKQAINDVDKDQWVKAMDLEMESMYFNSVWELVDLPEGVKPIGCKSIYKRKRDSTGKPEGFITKGQEQKVCKLNRSIYGLKQASRSWNIRFDTVIKSYGFDQNVDEPCVYKKINKAQFQMKDLGEAQYVLWDPNHKGSPDICYAMGIVSRYQSNPGLDHWTAVKIIFKYLRRMRDYMLVYGAKDLILTGYTDFDFQTDKDSRKSTSGSVFTLNGGAIVWRSIKQGCIVDSTMEAEYVAACEVAKEAVWLRKFLHDLEVVPNMNLPITIYCDNSGAVANSKEPRSHK